MLKYFICLAGLFLGTTLLAQSLDKANAFYKNGAYAKAIPLYEAALAQKDNTAARAKLANAYRILNRPQQAAPLFAAVIKDKKARPDDFFHYGEVLMLLEQYDSAKVVLGEYVAQMPDDPLGKLLFENCDKVRTLRPYFSKIDITPFAQNTEADENAPVFYRQGLVFASDRASGFKLLKTKNPATGREFIDVWYSAQTGDTSFSAPEPFSAKLSELNKNTGNASFTRDGRLVFFARNSLLPAKNGSYMMQIYSAESQDSLHWHNVTLLPFCSNEQNYMYPAVSPDGQKLFFVSERSDGFGGLDLFVSYRTRKGWSRPENLGAAINTAAHEGFPFYTADGKLYFCSKGHLGFGGYDIFFTQQDTLTRQWLPPVNLGLPINSPYDDISIAFSDNALQGAFTSARLGQGDDIFLFRVAPDSLNTALPMPSSVDFMVKNSIDTVDTEGGYTIDVVPAEAPAPDSAAVEVSKAVVGIAVLTTLQNIEYDLNNGKMRPNKRYIWPEIQFQHPEDTLLSIDMQEAIRALADLMRREKKIVIDIITHTETDLPAATAKTISIARSEAIRQALLSEGIKEKRLKAIGYGGERPLKDCAAEPCSPNEQQANRRIELRLKEF